MDNAAKWFLAGIVVSLINTALVLFFIGIPGLGDDDDEIVLLESIVETLDVEKSSVGTDDVETLPSVPPVTYVLVKDQDGNVVVERTELAEVAKPAVVAKNTLGLTQPRFAQVARPAFLAASNGTAWVTVRGGLELWRVNLEGHTESEDIDGIDDLGESTVVDIDVASNGALYALVADGTFDWRLFQRPLGGSWALLASSELSGWPAEVGAITVGDNNSVYLSANQPSGMVRLIPPFKNVSDWVPGVEMSGIDTAADNSLQVYAAPQGAPEVASEQVGYQRGGKFGVWQSNYAACDPSTEAQQSDSIVPKFPRDVAIVDDQRVLVLDSLNHVLRLQPQGLAGEVVFGVPCEQGEDERHLLSPTAVAIDENGNVFIADTGNNRVVVLPVRTEDPEEVVVAAPVAAATIEFGQPNACPGEDCSAANRAKPVGVRVEAGNTVRFNINGLSHQVGVYGPGLKVSNIDVSIVGGAAATPGSRKTIMDPNGRVAASPTVPFDSSPATTWDWNTTGVAAGTYLFICTFQPNLEAGMHGWVIVE